jgi:hypothetical protein
VREGLPRVRRHDRFVTLVPNERIVEAVEFETADPAMQGEMTMTITLAEGDGGTDLVAVHDNLPPGLPVRTFVTRADRAHEECVSQP